MLETMEGHSLDSAAKRARLDIDAPSEADILRLVSQRESLRQQRRFAESDAIREELRSMGVELYDKEKEWRARDGRRGTLFTAGPSECPLSDSEIQDRIREREDARKSKDWDRADTLRDELRRLGVELDDKESVWRTNSGRVGSYTGAPVQRRLTGMQIRKLVAERERHRAAQDFEAADELRRQLSSNGIELFDNERIWRSSDGQQGVIITGGHEVDCFLTDAEIATRVAQREDARAAKNWAQADAIRDELRRQGVELLDNQKLWCTTDGRSGHFTGGAGGYQAPSPLPSARAAPAPAVVNHGASSPIAQVAASIAALLSAPQKPAAQGALGRLAPALATTPSGLSFSDASIIALVHGRERARERHDWEAADAIRADLRSHGVDVWDKEKVWRASDGRSGSITRP